MNKHHLFAAAIAAFILSAATSVSANSPTGNVGMPASSFLRLVNATQIVENYQYMASVSARVFAARGQGSDKEYAEAMSLAATTDLSGAKGCIATALSGQQLTAAEAAEVSSIFESRVGQRLLNLSRTSTRQSVEQGRMVHPTPEGWTESDRRELAEIYQTPAFRSFSLVSTQRSFAEQMIGCYRSVIHEKHPGAKF